MASHAEHSGIRQLRHHRTWIFGMFGERTVAGFAVYTRVFAGFLYLQHIGVAVLAHLVPGIGDRL